MLLSATLVAAENDGMDTLFQLTCFNGKIDSDSKGSIITKIRKDGTHEAMSGGLTCGYPGLVSKITWKWNKDKESTFVFTRVFPLDSDTPKISTKEITYEGKRVIIFDDEHQVITIGPEESKANPGGVINSEPLRSSIATSHRELKVK
jgi:hypothetical protein